MLCFGLSFFKFTTYVVLCCFFFLPLKTQLRGFGGFVHSGLYRKSSEYESIAGTLNLTRCSFGEQCAVVTVGFFLRLQ